MKKITMLLTEEIGVGGFEVEVPEVRTEREAAEGYLGEGQPVVESTAQDLSRVIVPRAWLEDQTLNLSIEVQSFERAQQTAQKVSGSCVSSSHPKTWSPFTNSW